eukprot:jgi/Bigna1/76132/fgenesh1_pg.39_\
MPPTTARPQLDAHFCNRRETAMIQMKSVSRAGKLNIWTEETSQIRPFSSIFAVVILISFHISSDYLPPQSQLHRRRKQRRGEEEGDASKDRKGPESAQSPSLVAAGLLSTRAPEGHHEDDQPASDLSPHPSPSSTFRVSNASAATPAPVSASPSPRKKGFLAKTLTKVRDTVGRVRNGTRKTEQDMEEDDHKEAKQDALFATNEVKQITERGPPIAALEVRIIEGRQMDKSSRKPRIAVTVEGKTEHTEVCTGEKPEWHIIRPRKVGAASLVAAACHVLEI